MKPDPFYTISRVTALPGCCLQIDFAKVGLRVVDVSAFCQGKWEALQNPEVFGAVKRSEYGGGVEWEALGLDVGANTLWKISEQQEGNTMAPEAFRAWRKRLGLTQEAAARELGITRRAVAYYEQGGRIVPKVVLLACKALEMGAGNERAA